MDLAKQVRDAILEKVEEIKERSLKEKGPFEAIISVTTEWEDARVDIEIPLIFDLKYIEPLVE